MEAGDGHVSDAEQKHLADSLERHLMRYFPARAHSVLELSEWVQGISGGLAKLPVTLFERTGPHESSRQTAGKRLSSQAYWRYYFAFSAPQNVLSPQVFEQLFALADQPEKQQELAERLLGYIQSKNLSSRTWFEHILAQLTSPLIEARTPAECRGLLQFFFDNGDDMLERYRAHNEWFMLQDLDTYSVADRLIRQMLQEDVASTMKFLTAQLQRGKAWYWSAEYVRHLLWQHGIVGDRTGHQLEESMGRSNVVTLQKAVAKRLNSLAITEQLPAFALLNRYIWAWRDISGIQAVRKWVDRQVQEDKAFLNLLLQLRYHGTSSADGRYRALHLAEMTEFLGDVETVTGRIACIKETGHFPERVDQVEQSIRRNRF